ncbi:MAG: hypothetical protein JWL89_328 [Candidatus Saccharibacteria bacterium]|nr:hypothetical protein [Candidatus Saccharibacteria bacterium]
MRTFNTIARRRSTWTLIKGSILLIALTSLASGYLLTYPEPVAASSLARIGKSAQRTSSPTKTSPALTFTSSSSGGASIVPNCTPGAKTPQPTAPNLSPDQSGLQQVILPNAIYTVYGNTVSQISTQMAVCTPVSDNGSDRFAASTDYALNWNFRYQDKGDGVCTVTNASVGITIAEIFPSWQPSAGAAAGLSGSWQTFIHNLAAHEAGHVSLDQAAAATILSDLQSIPATDCGRILEVAAGRVSSNIAALNSANDAYDAATNHGATQGAVLR